MTEATRVPRARWLREPERANNFDLIRILAALQVAIIHGYDHLQLSGRSVWLDRVVAVLHYVPGVPVFFTVSGFLIAWSFDRTPEVATYARNRFARIYPALWSTLLVTIGLLLAHGVLTFENLRTVPVLAWLVGQVSIVQFYTPAAFRRYGIGNPNGALWTIPVEIQFYCVIPIVITVMRRSRLRGNLLMCAVITASALANVAIGMIDEQDMRRKLFHQTLVPWLFYFLMGSLAYANWDRLANVFRGKAPVWSAGFILYSAVASGILKLYRPSYWPNAFGMVATLLLAGLTLSWAFSWRGLADKILRGNDISYGYYLLHCVVLNVLVQHGVVGTTSSEWILLGCSGVLAIASWKLVEQPASRMVRRSRRGVAHAPGMPLALNTSGGVTSHNEGE